MKATDRIRRELELLNELEDSAIDTSDTPEVTDWSGATRGNFYRPSARSSTTADSIRQLLRQGRTPEQIAAELGVTRRQIGAVRAYLTRRGIAKTVQPAEPDGTSLHVKQRRRKA